MKTKLIGMKEFRHNMTKYGKEAQKKKTRFIVMRHTVPVFEITPLDEEDLIDQLILEKYKDEIEEAWQQSERGETFTSEEVRQMIEDNAN